MSGSRKGPATRDAAFLRDVWEWATTGEWLDGRAVRLVLTPVTRRGVWLVRLQACQVSDGRLVSVSVQQEELYPNATHSALVEVISGLCVRLDEEIARPNLFSEQGKP